MFSLQNQNQAIFTLSQISAIITPRQNAFLTKKAHKDKSQIMCKESFLEALKNCDFSFTKHLKDTSFLNNFKVSYVSHDTFFENKHGFSEADLKSAVPTLIVKNRKHFYVPQNFYQKLIHGLRHENAFTFDIQVRGFKTDRSVKAEMQRNPGLGARIKNALGLTPSENLDSKLAKDLSLGNEKMKQIFAAEGNSMTEAEKQRIKVAFAEGYLLANSPGARTGKAARYFKVFQQVLTIVIFLAIVISLMVSTTGSIFRIQLGNQVEVDPEEIHVTFDDVKGADEAKQELKDVVEFLKNPDKFSQLGGKLPKGVLLVGPPGTGKTLLARAVAGEAGVPFFHAAGPEFDEILVGQGARRVRDLFKSAKEKAPCVIFIDEIDSVGAKRTNSVLHPYANQTINQLLSEMDGFHQNEGVIVLGATNRRDDLDQALLRPGRFDVEVTVPTPDFTGRKEILGLYLGKVLAKDVDLELLARGTTGFTGADLENMVNQAALKAAIDGADCVSMKYLESARDKVLMGPERKSRIPDEEANLITAYHEGGHAIVAFYTRDSHPLHKVTIIPRGPSLGHTAYIPEKERYHVTKSQLLATMDVMMGGRAAEELIFGTEKITSGASSDLKQATSIATHMVKDWGMSEKIGLRTMTESSKPFQGDSLGPSTNELVDSEIRRILSESYDRAKHILKAHAKEHKALAEALMKYETLDAEDIKAIMTEKGPHVEKS
ncbi:ATP-dependent zinc metalloprotease YME1L [Tribolium castaneum]|uniref:ATP-dependent zinc metalloprotease YME1 homolog-like Protein n=1 Tax=Tribolium castaneum TaxID=7070 RepID=D6WSZ1_TRICA|nr:PREDICTED: ATP-dependent zinc metalloprotease YME1 homolog [Tribolium castaneum]EFA06331.1 ATP-dependent zinc metalloprotease YME1 homolog-like Protein [Tribolium castaneum]|eukprot:XP_970259.1 PREDICTED: ATP-dependent zinc metalloprotease YME1 homolog [Tribolium castaneum]